MKRFEQYSDMIGRLYPDLCVLEEGTEDREKHLSRTITFQVTDACNLACTYCLDGDTLICMADYSLKPIKDIEVGDKVLGFNEYAITHNDTYVYSSDVERIFVHKDKLCEVTFANGNILNITKNHKVLVKRSCYTSEDYDYTPIERLNIGDEVYTYSEEDNNLTKTKIASIKELDEEVDVYNIGTSSRTYIANGIAVHNCYQINKGVRAMEFETAKKLIDMLLTGDDKLAGYVDVKTSPAIIIEFIGGEPFLQIDLIEQICDYFVDTAIELEHPWADKFAISICSNGVLYFDPKVQRFLNKYRHKLSFSITIDGNKELHDACRIFPNGQPSYDLAVAGAMDWVKRGNYMGSKITIAPENLPYLYDAILHMVELGYDEINANVVYENVWKPEHAPQYYEQLIKIADYFIDNNLVEDYYLALFDSMFFKPMDENENDNWCFKAGTKILTSSGNRNIEDLKIGDEVIAGNGNIEKVENVLTHYAKDTYKVRVAGIEPIYTTAEHPFLTRQFLYTGNKGVRHFSEPRWVKASELKLSDKVAIHKHKFGEIHMDKDIAYIVGRYIGDGWHSTTGYKLCCGYQDVEELTEKLEKANVKFSTYDYRTVRQFNIYKSNTELLSIISDAGFCAYEKKIPKVVFSWDKDSVEALLKGYFDADGYYDVKDAKIKFNTVSPILVTDICTLLRALGYYPMYNLTKRAGKSKIEGRDVNIRDRYEAYFYLDSNRTARCSYDEENDVIWTTVMSSESTEPYEVYNLTVSNEHTFIANNIIVHNCGGAGLMLSCDPDGYLYPCIRYMESSLGDEREPLRIGNVDDGIAQCEEYKCNIDCLNCITRRSQSTDECFYCPIAQGCSWCTAWNFQVNGTPDSRCTFICQMHKARSLANVYYWNTWYRKQGKKERFVMHCPKEWALEIISEEEYNKLLDLSNEN